MPHVIVEYTTGVMDGGDHGRMMQGIARAMDSIGCFAADDIKVRCREIPFSFMGVTPQEHAYVAVEVQVLDNKPAETLARIGSAVFDAVQEALPPLRGKWSVTVRMTLIDPALYFRGKNY